MFNREHILNRLLQYAINEDSSDFDVEAIARLNILSVKVKPRRSTHSLFFVISDGYCTIGKVSITDMDSLSEFLSMYDPRCPMDCDGSCVNDQYIEAMSR